MKINSILLLNLLIISCVAVKAFNKTIVDNSANDSELPINKSQQHFPLMNSKVRGVRGKSFDMFFSFLTNFTLILFPRSDRFFHLFQWKQKSIDFY